MLTLHRTQILAMPPRKLVGKSGVTPCKHFLLDKLVGRECGVFTRSGITQSYNIIDLTAGDGVAPQGEFTKRCSPGISMKHVDWLNQNSLIGDFRYIGIEKQPETYTKLVSNCVQYLDSSWSREEGETIYTAKKGKCNIELINGDSTNIACPLLEKNYGEDDGVFLYNDPNHVNEWCITRDMLQNFPRFTTSLSTLGCNVNGLKRLRRESREQWYSRVDLVTKFLLKDWHDACLFSVGGADQWAYLVTAPAKWRDKITTECQKAAKKVKGRTVSPEIFWYRKDRDGFKRLQDTLFLTKKENKVSA